MTVTLNTPEYAPPEFVHGKENYTQAADIWQIGLICKKL